MHPIKDKCREFIPPLPYFHGVHRLDQYRGAKSRVCSVALRGRKIPNSIARSWLPTSLKTPGAGDFFGWPTPLQRVLKRLLAREAEDELDKEAEKEVGMSW